MKPKFLLEVSADEVVPAIIEQSRGCRFVIARPSGGGNPEALGRLSVGPASRAVRGTG